MHISYYKRILFILLIFYIVFISLRKDQLIKNDFYKFADLKKVQITAIVAEFPKKYTNRTNVVLKIKSVNGRKCGGKAIAYFNTIESFPWRSTVNITGDISQIDSSSVFGNSQWKNYLFAKGIITEVKAYSGEVMRPPGLIARVVNAARGHILKTFRDNFSSRYFVILSGVTLGETGFISKKLKEAFRDSGAMHLLVASGSNVGFVTLIIYFLASLLKLKRKNSAFIALIFAGLYTLCAGADPPLVRAYVMTVFATLGFLLQRESGVFQGLIASCFLILIFAPYSLFHAGFQMSFLATLGIILAVSNYKVSRKLPFLARFTLTTFIVSAGAQIMIYPVLALVFNRVSVISVISNIFLVPLAGIIMGLGFIVSLTVMLPAKLFIVFVYISKLMLWVFVTLVNFFADIPFAAFKIPSFGLLLLISYYLIAFVILNIPLKTVRKKISLVFVPLAAVLLIINFTIPKKGSIYLISSGYKQSVLIKTKDRKFILVDAGIKGKALAKAVTAAGGLHLDSVFLTGLGHQSYSGLKDLSKLIKIKKVYMAYGEIRPAFKDKFLYLKNKGVEFVRLWAGDRVETENLKIETKWGLMRNKNGEFWRKIGYSGRSSYDGLSYNFTFPEITFEVGSKCRFINVGGSKQFCIISKHNKSIHLTYKKDYINVKEI